ncbi:hypothetical protein V2J09_008469 [Rumex salicifolius]
MKATITNKVRWSIWRMICAPRLPDWSRRRPPWPDALLVTKASAGLCTIFSVITHWTSLALLRPIFQAIKPKKLVTGLPSPINSGWKPKVLRAEFGSFGMATNLTWRSLTPMITSSTLWSRSKGKLHT